MPGGNDQEKTEQPTSKKLEDARKKGQIAQSREVPSAAILLTALGFFMIAGGWMFNRMALFMADIFDRMGGLNLSDILSFQTFFYTIVWEAVIIVLPIMLATVVAGILANIFQFGLLFSSEALSPKFSKLNPLTGIKRIVSFRSLVELAKSIFKVTYVGLISYIVMRREFDAIPGLMNTDVAQVLGFIGQAAFRIAFYVCLGLIVLAIIDYAYQNWQHKRDLRMTKQEIKDEMKQLEGDPKVKGRIRQKQLEMAQQRMMEMVPEADVVITNPTRLAIALKFDSQQMIAPQVVAKGAGHVAGRIREIARENGVPLVENKPLARTLFNTVEIGDAIPVDLYRAVAEVLAYVYRLKGGHQPA